MQSEQSEQINADATKRAVRNTNDMGWTPSPTGSVARKRVHLSGGAESGQVTSVVKYHRALGSRRIPTPKAKRSWCSKASSRTNTGIGQQAPTF